MKAMGHSVIDPTKNRYGQKTVTKEFRELREHGRYGDFCRHAEIMMKRDIAAVRRADAVIVYLPRLAHACGTIAELYYAWRIRKPVYLVHLAAVPAANDWLIAMTLQGAKSPDGKVFKDVKAMLAHIRGKTRR